jgi:hypothetical protein
MGGGTTPSSLRPDPQQAMQANSLQIAVGHVQQQLEVAYPEV